MKRFEPIFSGALAAGAAGTADESPCAQPAGGMPKNRDSTASRPNSGRHSGSKSGPRSGRKSDPRGGFNSRPNSGPRSVPEARPHDCLIPSLQAHDRPMIATRRRDAPAGPPGIGAGRQKRMPK
ncbi:hypothetical protein OJJOAM_000324 [Cupriavidus sp. H18C1]|uniref:hypothetical protein n=1 Tax=Cupriavidus sp. H18C1 TaxID=3241601 RepID=UPI003BB941FD